VKRDYDPSQQWGYVFRARHVLPNPVDYTLTPRHVTEQSA
jgi:hypothetical protein